MKMVLKVGVVILLILAVILAFNVGKIKRLLKVNALFEAENIVHNFSNMNEVLYARDLAISGDAHEWPETPEPMPETVDIYGEPRNVSDLLEQTSTTSFMVIRDGNVLFEDYYLGTDVDDLRISWSMAKSYLSAMLGKAVSDGRIKSLDDAVSDYVPALKGSAYEGVPIRHVMNMASGVKFSEDYLDPKSDINKMGRVLGLGGSMDKFAASLETQAYPSGTARQYVSIDTHVLGMVLRSVTGKTLHDLFEETFGSTLGFGKTPYYLTDGKGVAFALGGLNLRTRDYALFGQLFLQGGEWKGEQIIPAKWVSESTKASAPQNDLDETGVDYGYQWWVPTPHQGDFFAVGIYGQYIYVNPSANMVIVKNSAHREFTENGPSGHSHKLETIALFRALAEHFKIDDKAEIATETISP
ncbi:MAG: serine hydrolase domain-containing protein [Maricaulaceae bacterium]